MSHHFSSSANNKLRCFKSELGSIVSKETDGEHWSKEERKFHINVLDRTEGSQIGINDVHDAI